MNVQSRQSAGSTNRYADEKVLVYPVKIKIIIDSFLDILLYAEDILFSSVYEVTKFTFLLSAQNIPLLENVLIRFSVSSKKICVYRKLYYYLKIYYSHY